MTCPKAGAPAPIICYPKFGVVINPMNAGIINECMQACAKENRDGSNLCHGYFSNTAAGDRNRYCACSCKDGADFCWDGAVEYPGGESRKPAF